MIVTKILDPLLIALNTDLVTRYSIIEGVHLEYYGEFTFNNMRWKVYQIGYGPKFALRVSATFRNMVLSKYGLSSSKNKIIDLDNVPTMIDKITRRSCYAYRIDLLGVNFVMFG